MIKVNESKETATEEYKRSVQELVRIALMGTGGSRVAAQVLLSAYNGNNFQVDVTDLGLLDRENFGHALRVIWGRNMTPWMEPQRVIENGDAVFSKLWDDWRRLHIQNRWKRPCPDCDGYGWDWGDDEQTQKVRCRRCEGRGIVARVEWPGYEDE